MSASSVSRHVRRHNRDVGHLHQLLIAQVKERLRAGRNRDFGACVGLEAQAADTARKIQTAMEEGGLSERDAANVINYAKRVGREAFRRWEEDIAVNAAGRMEAREARPEWFGRMRPVEPYLLLHEALAHLRWAIEFGRERFAAQERLKAACWSEQLAREMEWVGRSPEQIAEAMWRAWRLN